MADTTYAPSITHITDKHLWMYPLKHEICGRETVCKGKYKKLGSKRWNWFTPFQFGLLKIIFISIISMGRQKIKGVEFKELWAL